ncbi:LysR family transcriptional regulator [Desulfovibrio cuneatus]|uniref:LysR family transcriptional regulator n=1 Tax=Desulfovibrio cuneatus TaxID=159728 RepID=UPI00041CDD4E|nr:LysR family transcriptional regulator [Desulfovibrio cuneatus]
MYDLRKLEAFCKVCELKSFSKAGAALFLSQPTVSAHIQTLERELNTKLVDRLTRTVLPTPAGEILLRHCHEAFQNLAKAKEEIDSLHYEATGTLRIASTTIPAHHVLPSILAHFLTSHPKVQPKLTIASSMAVLQKVRQGEVAAGIVGHYDPTDADLYVTPLIQDDIVVIAPATIPPLPSSTHLAGLAFGQAAALPWIMREETSTTRKLFEEALRLAGYDPRALSTRITVDSSHAAMQYVAAGLGLSIASHLAAKEALANGTLRAVSIAGVSPCRTFSCVVNTRRAMFPTTKLFLHYLCDATSPLRHAHAAHPTT